MEYKEQTAVRHDNINKNSFFKAARNGECDVIKEHLDAGFDINSVNEMGETALMLAVLYGDEKLIDLLLEQGANIDVQHSGLTTSLPNVTYNNGVKQIYVPVGGIIRIPGDGGGTPPSIERYGNETALMYACVRCSGYKPQEYFGGMIVVGDLELAKQAPQEDIKRRKIFEKLLAAGASTTLTDTAGSTPLIRAAMLGNAHAVKALLKKNKDNINHTNDYGNTALALAVCNGHAEVAIALIKVGANTDQIPDLSRLKSTVRNSIKDAIDPNWREKEEKEYKKIWYGYAHRKAESALYTCFDSISKAPKTIFSYISTFIKKIYNAICSNNNPER